MDNNTQICFSATVKNLTIMDVVQLDTSKYIGYLEPAEMLDNIYDIKVEKIVTISFNSETNELRLNHNRFNFNDYGVLLTIGDTEEEAKEKALKLKQRILDSVKFKFGDKVRIKKNKNKLGVVIGITYPASFRDFSDVQYDVVLQDRQNILFTESEIEGVN